MRASKELWQLKERRCSHARTAADCEKCKKKEKEKKSVFTRYTMLEVNGVASRRVSIGLEAENKQRDSESLAFFSFRKKENTQAKQLCGKCHRDLVAAGSSSGLVGSMCCFTLKPDYKSAENVISLRDANSLSDLKNLLTKSPLQTTFYYCVNPLVLKISVN